MWDQDIKKYCQLRNKDPQTVAAILLRKGWMPENYRPEMKKQLFDFLDKWYTLSIKKLPTPATLRKNPTNIYRRLTSLPGGWNILTTLTNGKYITRVLGSEGAHFIKIDDVESIADTTHLRCVERVVHES